ncbi:para-nitrobenzyl esterase [Gaeumannomyces tritici R3-111a-1]|uniref:Carboxylic ester hydrolase n=1 Tax=Gaeumannomyces tritici (strain R3-111a-1) TaxID=644352 RepID=J3NTF2_GAET3|nr:para-nitrobenzyl esterase [Gaeumannomyces tritici R3-111a-1]EJT79467.1 para-nitrobenzyl esterase [Gaeumannomyces tritici R3-111a-1]
MKLSSLSGVALAQLAFAGPTAPRAVPLVTLDGYGTFSGISVDTTFTGVAMPSAVDAWLGMDYATQPVGECRFEPVDWPAPFEGVVAADKMPPGCPQAVTAALPAGLQSEACLRFGVWRTPGVPLSEKLPVMVFIPGGAFNRGNMRNFDGASFVANSPKPIVFVSFHHRVGALGFPNIDIFERAGLLNLGIRDTRHFLEFVQKHIGSFGGDEAKVTLGGLSAGAHGVGIQHVYGHGKPLFSQVYYMSGSSTSRGFPGVDYPLYKRQAKDFLDRIGCADIAATGDDAATISCLKAAPMEDMRAASVGVFQASEKNITWAWQPTHGGALFETTGTDALTNGSFFHVPVLTSNTHDEARLYIPGTLETNKQFVEFMNNICPGLNGEDLADLERLYPDPLTNADSPYVNSPNSTQYSRLSGAWTDYSYHCPSQSNAYYSAIAGQPVWKSLWNTPNKNPAWQGVPHSTDASYTWAEPTVQYPEMARAQHGYIASFVLAGDPNTYRYPGTPEWPRYEPAGYGLDAEPASQLEFLPGGPRLAKDDMRREACLFWRDPVRAKRLNK